MGSSSSASSEVVRAPQRRWHWALGLMIGAALLLCGVYFSYTGPTQRNTDALAHVEYMRYLLEHRALPPRGMCTPCHHPPLYYLLGAGALWLGKAAQLGDPLRAVQAFSLLLTALFLLFAAATFRWLLPQRWQQTLATALVAFWPYTIIQSARINPDVAVNAVSAVALYAAARWWQQRSMRWLWVAGVAAAASLLIKTAGVVLIAALIGLLLLCWWHSAERRTTARQVAPVAAALALVVGAFALLRGARDEGTTQAVLGTAYKNVEWALERRPDWYYGWFDLPGFFAEPFAENRMGHPLEPTFWNHWLKSSMFGTYLKTDGFRAHTPPPNLEFAVGHEAALLAMLLFLGIGVALTWRQPSMARRVGAVVMASYTAGALAFHLLIPMPHHADFRHVFPLVLGFALLVADTAGKLWQRRRWLWHGSYLLASEWAALTAAYIWPVGGAAAAAPPAAASPGASPSAAPSVTPTRPERRPVRGFQAPLRPRRPRGGP